MQHLKQQRWHKEIYPGKAVTVSQIHLERRENTLWRKKKICNASRRRERTGFQRSKKRYHFARNRGNNRAHGFIYSYRECIFSSGLQSCKNDEMPGRKGRGGLLCKCCGSGEEKKNLIERSAIRRAIIKFLSRGSLARFRFAVLLVTWWDR